MKQIIKNKLKKSVVTLSDFSNKELRLIANALQYDMDENLEDEKLFKVQRELLDRIKFLIRNK